MNLIRKNIENYWHIGIPLLIWGFHMLIILFFLPGQALKDERIFFDAALSFKNLTNAFTFEFLKTYNSPQTPLSFYIAGLLLNLKESITILRISNSIFVMLTLLVFCASIKKLLPEKIEISIMMISIFLLNPYIHFIGILFYTDALYILCVALILNTFVNNRKGIVFYLSMFAAPLVRQFGVIFAAGSAIFEVKRKYPFINRNFIFSVLCLSGLLFFLLLWQGSMPLNSFMDNMLKVRQQYGSLYPYIPAYHLSALGFYMSPLFLFYIRKIYKKSFFVWGGIAGSVLYILFPARQNYSNLILQPYMKTLGFYHKLMLSIFNDPYFHIILIFFAFIAGGWIFFFLRSERIPGILKIWTILFFVMSFFNLQAWDKYLLDIQAVLIISLVYFIKPEHKS